LWFFRLYYSSLIPSFFYSSILLFSYSDSMLSSNEIKERAGRQAAALVQPGMTVGIGTGSTAYWFIEELGKRVQAGLDCTAVVTSTESGLHAGKLSIRQADLNAVDAIDLTIDGADEIDPNLQLIKGGGGALLQEKMVAAASKQLVIIADQSKYVQQLGAFPLPVEVIRYGWIQVARRIERAYNISVIIRERNHSFITTDHGHYILDCHFKNIPDPAALNTALHLMPGVVETGLFINMATRALVGYPDGRVEMIEKSSN
jgi:ribose 5-phosphate isomerase A